MGYGPAFEGVLMMESEWVGRGGERPTMPALSALATTCCRCVVHISACARWEWDMAAAGCGCWQTHVGCLRQRTLFRHEFDVCYPWRLSERCEGREECDCPWCPCTSNGRRTFDNNRINPKSHLTDVRAVGRCLMGGAGGKR